MSFGQTLAEKISVNKNFISLMNNFDEVLKMPLPEKFVAEFDEQALLEKGNSYIFSISGIEMNRLENINKDIEINIQGLKTVFPELTKMSQEELKETMVNASNNYSTSLKANPCDDCKRKGRAEMSAGIFLGGATGGIFGPFGVWAGATLGFWVAAENALACVKAHC